MRKKLSWLMVFVMTLSLFASAPLTAIAADVTERYIYDAEALPDGTIGVLFIYGGSSSGGIVTGGNLYYGVYDPGTNDWSQEPVTPGGGSPAVAKDAAMALDRDGKPHIAYITSDNNLGYTYRDGAFWRDAEILDSIAFGGVDGALSSPDIAIDSSSCAHISYLDLKGGYTDSNNYSSYDKEDLVYASNVSGSFEGIVRSYSHGWFYSPDGWRNLVYAPVKITLIGDSYCIGAKQYQYNKWMGGQDHIYGYDLLFDGSALDYPIHSGSTNSDSGFKLFEVDSDGSTVYSLFTKSGSLYITGGITELVSKAFSASAADMTVAGGGIYYAAISTNGLLIYQDGVFQEGLTLSQSILTNHTRTATVVADNTQYIFYTGSDSEKSLFIASISTSGEDLTEYKVPNKAGVVITGVTVGDKEYDGTPAAPVGTLSVSGADLTEEDLDYTYSSTDGGGYSSTEPPAGAGEYKLVISVPESNPDYIGSSGEIPFHISKKSLSVSGTDAVDRTFEPGNTAVELATAASVLSGLIPGDESNVTLDKTGVAGAVSTADAGTGKAVTVTGFALSGAAAGNYSLAQPSGITVDISPLTLAAPAAALTADSIKGGLSVTITDDANTAGVSAYAVEIYSAGTLKKTVNDTVKEVAINIPLEGAAVIAETDYTAKAKAVADASGNYADSPLGAESASAVAAYAPLSFQDNEAYDIPLSQVGVPISLIGVSGGAAGGKEPYTFTALGLPNWAQISADGVISGTPGAAGPSGAATVTVTDALSVSESITIAYGSVERGNSLEFGGEAIPDAKTYGDAPVALTLTYDGQAANVSYSVLSGPGSISGNTLTITGAGEIVIRATGNSLNYETKTQDFTVSVSRKAVIITPDLGEFTKGYGQSDPEFSFVNTVLIGTDSLSGGILSRVPGDNAGSYALVIAADAETNNPNYSFSLASGSYRLTITKKPLTVVSAVIADKPYNGTIYIVSEDVTEVILSGDLDSMMLGTDFEVRSASFADSPYVGTDKPTEIIIALRNTAKANNYLFESGADTFTGADADITTAVQVISAVDQTLAVGNTMNLASIASSNASGAQLNFSIDEGMSFADLSGSILTGTAEGTVTVNIDSDEVNAGGTSEPEFASAVRKQIDVHVSEKENGDSTITFTGSTITYGEDYTPDAVTTLTDGNWSFNYSGTALDGIPYSGSGVPAKAGNYTVTVTYENATHIGVKTAALTISAKPVTITGVTAADRPYNGSTDVYVSGGTLRGVEPGDAVFANVPSDGTISNANAGINKTVAIGTVTLTGADKDNYILTQPDRITVDIAPRVITFDVDSIPDRSYTGMQVSPDVTVWDGSTELNENTDYTVDYGENINAGAGTVTVSGIGNYLGSSAGMTFHINKSDYFGSAVTGTKQVIADTPAAGVTYDLSSLSFPAGFINMSFHTPSVADNSDGLISGTATVNGNTLTFDTAGRAAGDSAVIHVKVSNGNYNDITAGITVTAVDKTPVVVTGVSVNNKEYDGTPVNVEGTPVNSEGYDGFYEYLYEGTGSTGYNSSIPPANAGTYRLTVRVPLSDSQYAGEQVVNFTVTKALLTVKPKDLSINVSDPLPVPVVEYAGLKGTDSGSSSAVLSGGSLDMEIKAADGAAVLASSREKGSYTIKFVGSPVFHEADNYTIQTADGMLTISSKTGSGGTGGGSAVAIPEPSPEINTETGTVSANQIVNALKAVEKGGNVSINVTGGSRNAAIPSSGIRAIADNKSGLLIATSDGEITFSPGAVAGISNEFSQSNSAEFVLRRVRNSKDHEEIADLIQNNKHVYDVSVLINGKHIHEFTGTFSLTLLYDPDGYTDPRVLHIKADGSREYFKPSVTGNRITISGRLDLSYFAVIEVENIPAAISFIDVPESAWYSSAVKYAIDNGLFSGTSETTFSPGSHMTRGMLVTVLYRMAGSPETGTSEFTDASQDQWYADAVAWSSENNIASGTGNGKFGPNQPVTREQMAVILYRYTKYTGTQVEASGSLGNFSDSSRISSWASDAMSWSVEKMLLTGKGGGILDPGGTATRAEVATILQRLRQNILK